MSDSVGGTREELIVADDEITYRLSVLGSEQHDSLVLACLKSRWLNLGIMPSGKNTPETPDFAFLEADDICSLRDYFRSGSHRVREGVVYRGLAFVQQVDMGDEWLVLKRRFDGDTGDCYWEPIDSYSFTRTVATRQRFECAIQAFEDFDEFDIAALLGKPSRQRQTRACS